jgi:glycosyltransferase involved in cell wall biosynthesis
MSMIPLTGTAVRLTPARLDRYRTTATTSVRQRILFLTRSLTVGGAERQLVVLARGLHTRGHAVSVCVFYGGGALQAEVEGSGIRVIDLAKRGRWDTIGFLARLAAVVRREKPDILHPYLGVSNVVSVLVRRLSPKTRVVWGVRSSLADQPRCDAWEKRVLRVSTRLARHADLIIANSTAGARDHVAEGYPAERTTVIPNGIDTTRFRPDPDGRERLRREWGIGEAPLVGIVARLDPLKDHASFLRAVGRVQASRADVQAVCVGDGPAIYKRHLMTLASEVGADVRWEPTRTDLAAVYSAFDVACLTSTSEGFSNVLAEAMACGTPCVSTDVGDAGLILGGLGAVVQARDVAALAEAIETMLSVDRRTLGPALRAWIETNFGVDLLVRRTEAALGQL